MSVQIYETTRKDTNFYILFLNEVLKRTAQTKKNNLPTVHHHTKTFRYGLPTWIKTFIP